jgi:copper chaperone
MGGSTLAAVDNPSKETAVIELNVNDMTCGHCVSAVTKAVKSVDPRAEVRVDLGSKRVSVASATAADRFIGALADAGYEATPSVKPAPAATRKGCCGCT